MTNTPDFAQLAQETLWAPSEWERAWRIVSAHDARLWPLTVQLVEGHVATPTTAAQQLVGALRSPVLQPLSRIGVLLPRRPLWRRLRDWLRR